jgi:integrase
MPSYPIVARAPTDATALIAYQRALESVSTAADRRALAERMTLSDWAPIWWTLCVAQRMPGTRVNYERAMRVHVLPHLGHVAMLELDTPTVATWVDRLSRGGLSPDQTRMAMRTLSTCLRQAAQRGLLSCPNPVPAVDRPTLPPRKIPRALSAEQIEFLRMSILSYIYGSHNEERALRSATIVSVMAYGGLRPGEVMGAKVGDIDFTSQGLWVRDVFSIEHRPADTKTHAQRFAPLPDQAMADLTVWMAVRGGSGREWLFPGQHGTVSRSTHESWRRAIRVLCAQIAHEVPEWAEEFAKMRPYELRHSCASLRIRAGEPLVEVASDLGHSTEMLLRRYTHIVRALRRQPVMSIDAQIAQARERFDTLGLSNDLRDRALAPKMTPYQRQKLRGAEAGHAEDGPFIRHINGKVVWFNERPDRRRRRWRVTTVAAPS